MSAAALYSEDVVSILSAFIFCALQLLSRPFAYLGIPPLEQTTQKAGNECEYLIQPVPACG